jgi:hypothetical protein
MDLRPSWGGLEARLQQVAENPTSWDLGTNLADQDLVGLGLVSDDGSLTDIGDAYYMAKFVRADAAATREAIADILKRNSVARGTQSQTPSGGISGHRGKSRRLAPLPDQEDHGVTEAGVRQAMAANDERRRADRTQPEPPDDPRAVQPDRARRDRRAGGAGEVARHLISPDTPLTNIVALRELLRSARGDVRWYEPHLPGKALEVLFSEVDGQGLDSIRLLSGPANVTSDLKDDYKLRNR